MQGVKKKFTFITKGFAVNCGMCIAQGNGCILMLEVRNHERRRKEAGPLGNGRSQASGDPFRPYGESGAELKNAPASAGALCDLLCVENVLIQSAEGFFHTAQGQS